MGYPGGRVTIPLRAMTWKCIAIILGVLFTGPQTYSMPNISNTSSARPLLILIESNPWEDVVGSSTPSFALYDSGLLILLERVVKGEPRHVFTFLDQVDQTKFLNSLPIEAFNQLESHYEVSTSTDQPTHTIWLFWQGRNKKVTVYGDLRLDESVRMNTPQAFLTLFQRLTSYKTKSAKPWYPEKIEVLIWPYPNAPDPSIPWPDKWPDIDHSDTQTKGDVYSLFLSSRYWREFRSFLAGLKNRQAVLINGRKWAISYRFPFPGEGMWEK